MLKYLLIEKILMLETFLPFYSCVHVLRCHWWKNNFAFFKNPNFYIFLDYFVSLFPGKFRSRFFDRCILTDRALKLILYDFYSNFISNMWPVKFFWSANNLPTPGCLSVTVNDCRFLWNYRFVATLADFSSIIRHFFHQPMNRFVIMLQTNLVLKDNIGWGID